MTAFAPGDVFLAASDVDDSAVDLRNHRGPGRVLHLDAGLRLKAALFTGTVGLVIGLGIEPGTGVLYACDSGARTVARFAPDGTRLEPWPFLPERGFSSIVFAADGSRAWLGVHSSMRGDPHADEGKLFEVDVAAGTAVPLDVAWDGGKFGFHRVTHTFLAADLVLWYVSENGRRVMRYDLKNHKQLPDYLMLSDEDERGTCGLAVLADGRVLMATGSGAVMLSPDGETMFDYPVAAEKGWSRLTLAADGRTVWISNFFTGILEQREIETGTLVRRHDIARRYALSGLAEFPG